MGLYTEDQENKLASRRADQDCSRVQLGSQKAIRQVATSQMSGRVTTQYTEMGTDLLQVIQQVWGSDLQQACGVRFVAVVEAWGAAAVVEAWGVWTHQGTWDSREAENVELCCSPRHPWQSMKVGHLPPHSRQGVEGHQVSVSLLVEVDLYGIWPQRVSATSLAGVGP